MRLDPRILLGDANDAAAETMHLSKGMDSGAYAGDALTQAAVEHKFEIIGEALTADSALLRASRAG